MAALELSPFSGRVVWLGRVADREAALAAAPADALRLTFAGPEGEAHGGLTRPSCSRVLALHPRGTPIANTRQLSILSAEELALIAADMGLAALDPGLLGATMVVEGIPDFTHLPPSSRLQGPDGATLVIDMENLPCTLPARPIEGAHPGFGARFKPAARGRRGVTAWVEREGTLHPGDSLRLFLPSQRRWRPS
ncbi:MAG: MOSC domain-containing protein [Gemmobacter sp.]|uniref:MOSC domain-containing protein n=1 Tax=Gemmobacter sp. TaxID=1898957 RepID=UPI0039191099